MEISYNCAKWSSATMYQKVSSCIVYKGAMNSFNEMLPLARMFPLAVMHMGQSFKTLISEQTITVNSLIDGHTN